MYYNLWLDPSLSSQTHASLHKHDDRVDVITVESAVISSSQVQAGWIIDMMLHEKGMTCTCLGVDVGHFRPYFCPAGLQSL